MNPTYTPSPPDQALQNIATDMIAALSVPGCAYVHRTLRTRTGSLPMGRQIVYERTQDGGYRLAIGDDARTPPLSEAQALATAFGVPAGAQWTAGLKRKGRVLIRFQECLWRATP